jgi:hypothetical protein
MKREEELHSVFYYYFFKSIFKSFFYSLSGLMISNALNILTVRMQNVDYPNNRSLFRAVKDLVLIDKHRMFYKGLFPISVACTNLYTMADY